MSDLLAKEIPRLKPEVALFDGNNQVLSCLIKLIFFA